MRKLLLIVDPQIDFINGTLPGKGARPAMDNLAKYIECCGEDYEMCVITADWHPYNHLSFVENGGRWPSHCVAFSKGAAIYPPVYEAALRCCKSTKVLTKGLANNHEEYSIFANDVSTAILDVILKSQKIDIVDICGLSGDICVSDTLEDGIHKYGTYKFNVLTQFSPSLDGGERLNEIISKHHLSCDR